MKQAKIINPRIYEIMIVTSKKLDRKQDAIDELIKDSIELFPDLAEHFEAFK